MPDQPTNPFFNHPILNSPYDPPKRYWELDENNQPTQKILDGRRLASYVTPVPKPKKKVAMQQMLVMDEGRGLSTAEQQYEAVATVVNEIRRHVESWRNLPNEGDWKVTAETARLLKHWRHHEFSHYRPFFCQVEAVETVIWLTEVAPQFNDGSKGLVSNLKAANWEANPELLRDGT